MKKQVLATAILIIMSGTAQAEYLIKVNLDKSSFDFKQYYDNVGVSPGDDNTTPQHPDCKVTKADLTAFGGELIKVSQQDGFKCVVDYIVPKSTFSPDCTSEYLPINQSLTNVLISKGVDGISSIGYFGECN